MTTSKKVGLMVACLACLGLVSPRGAGAQETMATQTDDLDELEAAVRSLIRGAILEGGKEARRHAAEIAMPLVTKLHERRPDAASLELLVRVLLNAQRFDDAECRAEEWVRWQPESWLAQFYLGNVRWLSGDYPGALEPTEQAFALAGKPEDRHMAGKQLAFVLEKMKRYEDAIVVYREIDEEESAQRVQWVLDASDIQVEPDGGTVCIELDENMRRESQRLEEELKALEDQR